MGYYVHSKIKNLLEQSHQQTITLGSLQLYLVSTYYHICVQISQMQFKFKCKYTHYPRSKSVIPPASSRPNLTFDLQNIHQSQHSTGYLYSEDRITLTYNTPIIASHIPKWVSRIAPNNAFPRTSSPCPPGTRIQPSGLCDR